MLKLPYNLPAKNDEELGKNLKVLAYLNSGPLEHG